VATLTVVPPKGSAMVLGPLVAGVLAVAALVALGVGFRRSRRPPALRESVLRP
jgi:hypothetical protein